MKAQLNAIVIFFCSVLLARADVTLKIGDAQGAAGREVEVPITISGSQTVGPIQFMVDYDPRFLEAVADPPGAEAKGIAFGKVVRGGMVAQNATGGGEWRIAMRSDEPITQDGELLRLRFRVKGKAGDSCTLAFSAAEAWEKESLFAVQVRTQPGTFTVTGGAGSLVSALLGFAVILLVIGGGIFLLLRFLRRRKDSATEVRPSSPAPASPPAPAPAPIAPTSAPPAAQSAGDDVMATLKKLKDMQAAGLISAEDFEKKKSELLSRM